MWSIHAWSVGLIYADNYYFDDIMILWDGAKCSRNSKCYDDTTHGDLSVMTCIHLWLLLLKLWNAFTLSQGFSIDILQAFKLCMNHLPSYWKLLCPWIYHCQLYTVATYIKCVMVIQPSQLYFLYCAKALLIYSDTAVSILIKQSTAHQLGKSRNTTL